jgi:hypothetical protein
MPRVARTVFAGLPHHATQRGSRRENVFSTDADRRTYLIWLKEVCKKHGNVMQAQHQQGATLRLSKVRPSLRKPSRAHAHLPSSWASQEARVISREAEKGCVPFVCPPLCLYAAKRRPVGWGHDARNNLSGRANILSGLRCSKRAEFPKRFPKPTRRQSQCPCHIAAGLLTKPCLNNAIDSVGWVLDAVNAGRGGMLAAHPGFSILPCC